MKNSTVYDCSIIELNRHHSDRKGNLTVVENKAPCRSMSDAYIIYMTCPEE